ncbi:MAG TPA: N-acetyl-gamma-glutamyl-phosphate reductase [Anaeromyxobacter sp.]|nr:N-acetyl-gamma-glutamyl-phosphate reductase [Anaeromyxobacter sp.]
MHQHPVAVVGASGYSGLELTRILARHPQVRLTALLSDRWAGEKAGGRLALSGPAAQLAYTPLAGAGEVEAELSFLATPAEVSKDLAPRLLARGQKVIDLSGAFRLEDPAAYPTWYGFEHPAPQLLEEARYGLPELSRQGLLGARLVANAGCYASAIALAIAPFVKAGLALPEGVAVTALSGVSGAGRRTAEEYSFAEIADDLRAYRLARHQHLPEIEQTVARYGGRCGPVSFAPVLIPIRRGILATAHLRLREGTSAAHLSAALEAAYQGEPFVRVLPAERVKVQDVLHSNRCHLGVALDPRAHLAVVVSALDNLVKGAAGSATQAMNAVLGLEETAGLDLLGG